MEDYVRVAVPSKGRTAQRMLYQLSYHNHMSLLHAEAFSWILEADRKRIDTETKEIKSGKRDDYSTNYELEISRTVCTDEQLGELAERKPEMLKGCSGLPGLVKLCRIDRVFDSFMTYPNLNRKCQPNRFVLRTYITSVGDVPVKLIGTEHYYAADHIISGAVDIAVAGFDEIAARFAIEGNTERIKRWPAFSNGKELAILGSAGLGDYCAHVIVARDPEMFKGIEFNEDLFRFCSPKPVLVDGKYQQIYEHFMKGQADKCEKPHCVFLESENLEKDVANGYAMDLSDGQSDVENIVIGFYPGIAMVNSGSSIKKNGLFCYGLPVHQSETCVLASRKKYTHDKKVETVADSLTLHKYKDIERMGDFANWFADITQNIGTEKWADMPSIRKMFLDEFDKKTWASGQDSVTEHDLYILEAIEDSINKNRKATK